MATASPLAGATVCGQAPCKGRPPVVAAAPRARTVAASPQGAVASGQVARACCPRRDRMGSRPRPCCKGLLPKRDRMGSRPWAAASRSDRQQGQRPRPREAASPANEVSPEGSSTCRRGGCPRRRRAAPPPA
ncbi:hypothetical protein GW17_00060537 [Ensete ventricosum]|nr:hypothetical protein GW17_00060537 [Ensete ventricosum]